MEYALLQGYSYITFVSSLSMLEHGTSVGWRITPLGAPAQIDGKLTVAAWIEVSEPALANVRRTTRMPRSWLTSEHRSPANGPSPATLLQS
jgi:acyl-homoserine lactone synthase